LNFTFPYFNKEYSRALAILVNFNITFLFYLIKASISKKTKNKSLRDFLHFQNGIYSEIIFPLNSTLSRFKLTSSPSRKQLPVEPMEMELASWPYLYVIGWLTGLVHFPENSSLHFVPGMGDLSQCLSDCIHIQLTPFSNVPDPEPASMQMSVPPHVSVSL